MSVSSSPVRWNEATLRRLYVDQRLSAGAIANQFGCSSQRVRDQLRRAGVVLRPRGNTKEPAEPVSAQRLHDLYHGQGLSQRQIGERLGFSGSGVSKLLRRYGVSARPRGTVPPLPPEPELEADLRRLYEDEHMSLAEIGARYGRGPDWVRSRVVRAGATIKRRSGPRPRFKLTGERLWQWHVDEGLSVVQIAERVGCHPQTVRFRLRQASIPLRRAARSTNRGLVPLTDELLRRLYYDEELTTREIADRLGCSATRISKALRRSGIQRRRRGVRGGPVAEPLPKLSPEELTEMYVHQQLTTAEIAARFGGSEFWAHRALRAAGIPRRQGANARRPVPSVDLNQDELTTLYVDRRLDDAAIGAHLGVPTDRVRRRRRELGVYRPLSPPPNHGPPPAPTRKTLRKLYVNEKLPVAVIAQRYHTATPTARRWLVEAEIPIRPRTSRAHRKRLPVDQLRELYEARDWTAAEIAAETGYTQRTVLRALHDAGVPVRRPRARAAAPLHERLLAALYEDPAVQAVLDRHGIRPRPSPGSIAERFPEPEPLSRPLLRELYGDLGLSARHVELLTGQPFEQILDALRDFGILVRSSRGFSPWLTQRIDAE
jgi:DNA-binding transcriptional regulator LsrR (DeoR family)